MVCLWHIRLNYAQTVQSERERETGLALASMRITEISVLLNLLSLL